MIKVKTQLNNKNLNVSKLGVRGGIALQHGFQWRPLGFDPRGLSFLKGNEMHPGCDEIRSLLKRLQLSEDVALDFSSIAADVGVYEHVWFTQDALLEVCDSDGDPHISDAIRALGKASEEHIFQEFDFQFNMKDKVVRLRAIPEASDDEKYVYLITKPGEGHGKKQSSQNKRSDQGAEI